MNLDPKTRAYRNDWTRRDRLKNPEKYRARARRRYRNHRDRILAAVKVYQERNREAICDRKAARYHSQLPEEKRRKFLATAYGITPEIYQEMYAAQGGRCAICCDQHHQLDIDHCHVEHRIRGLLCQRCNKGLGLMRDNPLFLRTAAAYLEGSK